MDLPTLTGTKIDGIEVAKDVKKRVSLAVTQLKSEGIIPCLATILIGENQASATYVRNKHVACTEVGIETKDHKLSSDISQNELNQLIDKLNDDNTVHGILIQLPLPSQLDEFETTSRIFPTKDVDGLTPHNVGLLSMGKAVLKACTPSGIMEMFEYYNIDLVGKPLYHLLLQKNATVSTCHSKTKNLIEQCRSADIIITAVGDRTKFTLTPDMIKENSIVIDVAIIRHEGKLVGDADFSKIIETTSYATPVPGGVGPMTVAMLLKNTVTAATLSKGIVNQN